jgi:hypothetical protein
MKDRKEKIDSLFDKNTAEQLSGVDWDRLTAAISRRLDEAEARKTSVLKYRSIFKIAAGAAAAAAVVIIIVMAGIEKPADVQLKEGQRAVVKFIESKTTALVEIKHETGRSNVMVNVGASQFNVARCDIEIIDLNGDFRKKEEQGSWIIISRPVPVYADNGVSKDLMSMICLF